jgi:hypothetical protein
MLLYSTSFRIYLISSEFTFLNLVLLLSHSLLCNANSGLDRLHKKKAPHKMRSFLYPEPGSNRHALRHRCLRPTRLPIPPSGQCLCLTRCLPPDSYRDRHPGSVFVLPDVYLPIIIGTAIRAVYLLSSV